MTDEACIAARQKLASQYPSNQSSMGDFVAAVLKLREKHLKGRSGTRLPVVP